MNKNKLKRTIVPQQYRFILDRGMFEVTRNESNLKFMLNKHLDDEDPYEFINSDMFNELLDKCIDARINNWVIQNGVYMKLGIRNKDRAVLEWMNDESQYIITD